VYIRLLGRRTRQTWGRGCLVYLLQ